MSPLDITKMVQTAAVAFSLESNGYTLAQVESHSLCTGGTMAVKLNGKEIMIIQNKANGQATFFHVHTFLDCHLFC